MARPLRLEFPGAVYHVTSRGNARQDIIVDDRDRTAWLSLLAQVIDRYGWLCHAYCLMDNHYHLLLETPQANLSLGSEAFIAQHQPNRVIRDIPRRQTQALRPSLRELFQRSGRPARLIHRAYRQYGYRLAEIADHLGVHAATVSRRLKQAEQALV